MTVKSSLECEGDLNVVGGAVGWFITRTNTYRRLKKRGRIQKSSCTVK